MKLSEFSGKSSNLQLTRFIAATLVMFAHAFVLSTGVSDGDWFLIITKNQLGMGAIAVSIFFLCGGFLICKSVFAQVT